MVVDGDEHARGSDGTRSAAAKCGAVQRTSSSEDADDHCIVQIDALSETFREGHLTRGCCRRRGARRERSKSTRCLTRCWAVILLVHYQPTTSRAARRELWANGALGPMCALESDSE